MVTPNQGRSMGFSAINVFPPHPSPLQGEKENANTPLLDSLSSGNSLNLQLHRVADGEGAARRVQGKHQALRAAIVQQQHAEGVDAFG
jgi:hypothetical protein